MHSRIYALLWDLLPLFQNIGLKSQRLDMPGDTSTIECQHAVGKSIFSAGVEGISPRIRRYLNKNLDEETLRNNLELIFKVRARELKIFLLSTGLEGDDDFEEFERLLDAIRESKDAYHARTRVIFSITPLVRFPWTPLEFGKAHPPEAHEAIVARVRQRVADRRFELHEAMGANEYLVSQVLVRASGDEVRRALLSALEETGFVYYRRVTPRFFTSFLDHLRREGVLAEDVLGAISYKKSLERSWALLDTGIKRSFLWGAYLKNVNFVEVGGLDEARIEPPAHGPEEYRERARQAKVDGTRKAFRVSVGEPGRGVLRKYVGIALARALMKTEAALTPYFRSYVSSVWASDETTPVWVTGDDIVTLAWDRRALPILEEALADRKFLAAVNGHLGSWGSLAGAGDGTRALFSLRMESPYEFDGSGYFRRRGLKHTLYRDGPASYHLKFTGDSMKKGIVSGCSVAAKAEDAGGGGVAVDIVPGAKFDAEEFVRETFAYPRKNDWVRIKVTSTMG
jgi:hypothetical protein